MVKTGSLPGIKTFSARFKNPKLGWWLAWIGFLFLTPFFSSSVWGALSLTFSGVPLAIVGDEAFDVQVSLVSAPSNRTYFLRSAFFQEGTSDYFGETLNNQGVWHGSAGDHTQFWGIKTGESGDWTGVLKAKADLDDPGFRGEGDYFFKIGRYTEAGSLSWSETEVRTTITLGVLPSPTSTATPTPFSLPSLSPSPSLEPTPNSTPAETPLATGGSDPTLAPFSGRGISLNELMVYPAEGEEWIEIKNENDFEVYLVDWYLDDLPNGGSKPFKFSLRIAGDGFGVIYVGTRFNNSGDVVRLIRQGGEEIETYPYDSAEKGYSFAKDEKENWRLTSDPTPGEKNQIVDPASLSSVPSPTWSPTPSPATSPTEIASPRSFPTPTVFLTSSGTVLGLADDYQTATESGGLTDWACPLIEELEADSSILKDGYPGENQDDRWFESDPKQKPVFNYFCLLGLGTMVGSFGFFLKDAGILVK